MIQSLKAAPMVSFASSANSYSRAAYESVVQNNTAIAQEQNAKVTKAVQNQANYVPMQGAGEKLDIMA